MPDGPKDGRSSPGRPHRPGADRTPSGHSAVSNGGENQAAPGATLLPSSADPTLAAPPSRSHAEGTAASPPALGRVPAEISLRLVRVPASLSVPHMQRRGLEPSFQVEMTWATAEPARVRFEAHAHLLTEQDLESISSWNVHGAPETASENPRNDHADAGELASPPAASDTSGGAAGSSRREDGRAGAAEAGGASHMDVSNEPEKASRRLSSGGKDTVELISASFSTLLDSPSTEKVAATRILSRHRLGKRGGEDKNNGVAGSATASAPSAAAVASLVRTSPVPRGRAGAHEGAKTGDLLGYVASAPDLETTSSQAVVPYPLGVAAQSSANSPSTAELRTQDARAPDARIASSSLSPALRFSATARLTFSRLRFAASSAMRPRWVAFTAWAQGASATLGSPIVPLVLLLVTLPTVVMSRATGQADKATRLLWGPNGAQEAAARRLLAARSLHISHEGAPTQPSARPAPSGAGRRADGSMHTPTQHPLHQVADAASSGVSTPHAQGFTGMGSLRVPFGNRLAGGYDTPSSRPPFAAPGTGSSDPKTKPSPFPASWNGGTETPGAFFAAEGTARGGRHRAQQQRSGLGRQREHLLPPAHQHIASPMVEDPVTQRMPTRIAFCTASQRIRPLDPVPAPLCSATPSLILVPRFRAFPPSFHLQPRPPHHPPLQIRSRRPRHSWRSRLASFRKCCRWDTGR